MTEGPTSDQQKPTLDSREFRRALSQFASGVTVVTTRDSGGRPQGLTVSAFCSLSLTPPLVMVSVDNRSPAHEGFEATRLFGVSVLAEGQEDWSKRFSSSAADRFAGVTLVEGAHGVVLVPGALVHIECRVHAHHEAGDHRIYLGEVLSLGVSPGRPLVYHAGAYCRLDPGGA
jgi:flavin reductase (DIM6/NTAB) family NADH-FMN oxidoreductase RutF